MAAAAAAGSWWAVVLAVAVLLGPGRVVANTEGESCLISYALVSDPRAAPVWIRPKFEICTAGMGHG
jgi:hypothetical protein